jgi:hypothetical protein
MIDASLNSLLGSVKAGDLTNMREAVENVTRSISKNQGTFWNASLSPALMFEPCSHCDAPRHTRKIYVKEAAADTGKMQNRKQSLFAQNFKAP